MTARAAAGRKARDQAEEGTGSRKEKNSARGAGKWAAGADKAGSKHAGVRRRVLVTCAKLTSATSLDRRVWLTVVVVVGMVMGMVGGPSGRGAGRRRRRRRTRRRKEDLEEEGVVVAGVGVGVVAAEEGRGMRRRGEGESGGAR